MKRRTILALGVVLPLVAAATQAEELWPTPYSAEQIRDAWFEGFWLDTRTETPDGVTTRRTRVVHHADDRVDMTDTALDPAGEPVGDSVEIDVTWEELRSHASFPRATVERERVTRDTALGEHAGYLFRVSGPKPGQVSEFFFADTLPGPPVVYRSTLDGREVMRAEQVARARRE